MKLGHIHLKVRDLDRSVSFYKELFDLEVTERIGNYFAFMTGNRMHHQLALQAKGPEAPGSDPAAVGLFHVAFEAADKEEFARKYHNLEQQDIQAHLIDHLISWAMYFDDPDGNGLEIYVDTRSEAGGSRQWRGINRPLEVATVRSHLT